MRPAQIAREIAGKLARLADAISASMRPAQIAREIQERGESRHHEEKSLQ